MSKTNKRVVQLIIIFTLVLTCASLIIIDYKGIAKGGSVFIKSILVSLVKPNFAALTDLSKSGVPFLILETLAIAFLGTVIGTIISIPLAFVSAQNMAPKPITFLGSILISLIRTFPPFVVGLILIRVSGPGAFTGVLTLALTSIGMITKLFIESIEDLDQGIIESLDASGCNAFQKIRYGILPQLFGSFLSVSIYRLEINVKNASILGLVGAGGIGAPLLFAMSGYRWADAGALLWGLIILVLAVEFVSTRLRRKIA